MTGCRRTTKRMPAIRLKKVAMPTAKVVASPISKMTVSSVGDDVGDDVDVVVKET